MTQIKVPDRGDATSSLGPYPQFILFGDSITQWSCKQELGFNFMPALQDDFIRRLDVINRGFSGYNTSQAIVALPRFMPTVTQAKVDFMAIFFGANDACLPGSATGQYVPLSEYTKNLQDIVQHSTIRAHSPRLILITPPPVNEYQMNPDDITRTAANTRDYARACLSVGEDLGIAVLDLWSNMMHRAGWKEGEPLLGARSGPKSVELEKMLSDGGLHLLPPAYKILYQSLVKLIQEEWPDETPQNTTYRLPEWGLAPKRS